MARWFDKQLNSIKGNLDQANDILQHALEELESLKDAQDEKVASFPENLQSTERFEMMENRMETFEEQYDNLNECIETLQTIYDELENIE